MTSSHDRNELKQNTAVSTSTLEDDGEFSRFIDLPVEIRGMIWDACLPQRIHEFDRPESSDGWFYKLDPRRPVDGCKEWYTSHRNLRPPTISRICRESREVALKSGTLQPYDESTRLFWAIDPPPLYEWAPRQGYRPHLTYSHVHDEWDHVTEEPWIDDVLGKLATAVGKGTSPGSFTVSQLGGRLYTWCDEWEGRPDTQYSPVTEVSKDRLYVSNLRSGIRFSSATLPDLGAVREIGSDNGLKYTALLKSPMWLVVMDTVELHCTTEAMATGIFGVYGDAPIQIIETAEEKKINLLYDLLAETNKRREVKAVQFQDRRPHTEWKSRLRACLWFQHFPDELNERLRPAIMFRLCFEGCNLKTPSLLSKSAHHDKPSTPP